ncbi:TIGR03085 family metal-binding protein [Umezawaea sp. NPDC059074]|uniref:TIGR03085 family metal-binding protein n=1 Tax=Umezawaea sp. NPDC059074 TaxID=3346716 RepID=UPI00368C90EB
MGLARDERKQLSDLFEQVGPDAPTLCSPWTTKDLAAHLVIRERRPDAAPGIMLKPLAGYTQKVQDSYAAKPWTELVDLVRTGPPVYSPYKLADELVNAGEFYIHHEDVRRAREGWEPRSPNPTRDAALWKSLKVTAKFAYRSSPVGLVFRIPNGESVTVKQGPTPVVVTGEPGELVLLASGRDAVRVEYDGDESAVAAVRSLKTGM